MDNSDDYFDDDFVLDDQALAVLDKEEEKFRHTASQGQPAPARHPPTQPPTKRQRTEQGWRPGLGSHGSSGDLDRLPEIYVQGDGSYWANNNSRMLASNSGNLRADARPPQPPPVLRNHRPRDLVISSQSQFAPPITSTPYSNDRNQQVQPTYTTPVASDPCLSQASPASGPEVDLLYQNRQLEAENAKIQAALVEALDMKLAREGEVSILRKGMEKIAQDHAAQVAALKAAKEEADAKQLQSQKEMKEELERLRTQFTFKQHDLEASIRKPPWTSRAKKINADIPPQSSLMPTPMRSWSKAGVTAAEPSRSICETPHRPRAAADSPRNRKTLLDVPKKTPELLGFSNAFLPPSPSRLQTRSNKGKERADPAGSQRQASQFHNSGAPPPSTPSSPTRPRHQVDVSMDDLGSAHLGGETTGADTEMVDARSQVFDGFGFRDWREELQRMILMHTLASSGLPTFQILMRTPIPPPQSEAYSSACSRMLEVLIAAPKNSDYDAWVSLVSESLIQMTQILASISYIPPLIQLLNLLTQLSISVPSFSVSLLTSFGFSDQPPRILTILCDVIRDRLSPSDDKGKDCVHSDIKSLAEETITLLEALLWNVPQDLEELFACVTCGHNVLPTLLDAKQPLWVLQRVTRLMVFLACRQSLMRSLLSFPNSAMIDDDPGTKDYSKIPHIEQLCTYLVDEDLEGPEVEATRMNILTFIATLSASHADALAILLESQTLIPSLVLYATNLATLIWEDDVELMWKPALAAYPVSGLGQTLFLLHHLVNNNEPAFNLRHKLFHASHRQFNGITHMFIVTFSRMSYADAPSWMDSERKQELEQMTDMARDLLSMVLSGPENDMAWNAFQDSADGGSEIDDEEVEARRLDTNAI